METNKCKKCEHECISRKDKKPLACRGCRSYTWDKDKYEKDEM